MATKQFRFTGLDNQHDPQEVGEGGLVVAANVDIMDDAAVRRRGGYTITSLTGTAMHSMWGNPAGTLGFVLDADELYQLDTALTPTSVGTMPSAAAVKFYEVNESVACVSTAAVRFVTSGAFVTPSVPTALDSETTFKALTTSWTGGQCVTNFNGRLYVGTANGILFSDPYNIGVYDTRDYLIPTPMSVLSIAAVDDGIWVGGADRVVFLSGESPTEFTYVNVLDLGARSITAVNREEWLDFTDISPAHAILTDLGVYLLANGGQIVSITGDKYAPPQGTGDAAIIRQINGAKQFLTTFTYTEDGHTYEPKDMVTDSVEV